MIPSDGLSDLLEGLMRPGAYPHPVERVRLIQTHISAVFLAGRHAYKVKKPVDFGFVDFSTLERRRHFCHEEVRLNRRLAPTVYEGVVPIVAAPDGVRIPDLLLQDPSDPVTVGPGGEVVEWAVRMVRLPHERTLKSLMREGGLDGPGGRELLRRLARLLADFHGRAERGEEISRVGDYPTVAANARENFDELEDAVGSTVSGAVLGRLREHTGTVLAGLRPLMEERARDDVPCDTHGDLRLGHVYHLADGSPGARIVIIDCIEFNDRFRYADPVSDIAFLAMELEFEGRGDLARAFADHYFRFADDPRGEDLLPYYIAYRDVVRGKVRTLTARDPAIPSGEREKAKARATRHFMRALGRLAPPGRRPGLILLGGLPGVGKSVLGRALAEHEGFTWIDTDRVRKELAGAGPSGPSPAGFEEGIYTPEWTERTYAECLRRAESLLFGGARVLVEGSFRAERHRASFLEATRVLGVPGLLLVCVSDREVVRGRLEARRARRERPAGGEASEADWGVYREMERRWEEPGPATAATVRHVRGDRPPEAMLHQARDVLRTAGLSTA